MCLSAKNKMRGYYQVSLVIKLPLRNSVIKIINMEQSQNKYMPYIYIYIYIYTHTHTILSLVTSVAILFQWYRFWQEIIPNDICFDCIMFC